MPFKSKAQAKFMFAKHPKIAKEFASKTPSMKRLPEHVGSKITAKGRRMEAMHMEAKRRAK